MNVLRLKRSISALAVSYTHLDVYKRQAYDLAIQTNGATLPVTFKFGTDDNPVFHKFSNMEVFTEFYTALALFIQQTLQEGWDKKFNINWSAYEAVHND